MSALVNISLSGPYPAPVGEASALGSVGLCFICVAGHCAVLGLMTIEVAGATVKDPSSFGCDFTSGACPTVWIVDFAKYGKYQMDAPQSPCIIKPHISFAALDGYSFLSPCPWVILKETLTVMNVFVQISKRYRLQKNRNTISLSPLKSDRFLHVMYQICVQIFLIAS